MPPPLFLRNLITSTLGLNLVPCSRRVHKALFRVRPRSFFMLLCLVSSLPALGDESVPGRGWVRVFLAEGCPIARYHTLTLRQLHEAFAVQGIQFEGYFPNTSATADSVAAFAKKYSIPFPVQIDAEQKQARAMQATVVPEVFVYDQHQKLVYRGRIDDTYVAVGKKRPIAHRQDLKDALQALIDQQPIPNAKTTPVGCLITFAQPIPKEDPEH